MGKVNYDKLAAAHAKKKGRCSNMRDLSRLLRPKSIAIVGGGEWGRNIIRNLQKGGFAGDVWPVHPKLEDVEGVPAFKSVDQLPNTPDVAYIAVNRHLTIDVTQQLSAMGAGGAICFASGFSESVAEDASGADLQAQLLDAAGDMTIIGPNCYGFLNYLGGAVSWPDQHGGRTLERGVAMICQSSNMAINISMQARGVPEEAIRMAEQRLIAINRAWEEISA